MKKNKIYIVIFLVLCLLFITSCNNSKDKIDGIKVTYELNGGTFQNCTLPISQYYTYKEDSKKLISDPQALTKAEITRANYTFAGWYTSNDFTKEWNFSTDEITNEGITLYAKWEKNIKYTYNLCYIDENNQRQVLHIYEVTEGAKFDDRRNKANDRKGYTALGFLQKTNDGFIPWNDEFTHPGGAEDLAIDVYVEYMEGEYELVRTKDELKKAKNKNIYLLNDIDFGGDTFSFNDYNKIFMGNGFTVKNFKVEYKPMRDEIITDHLDSSLKSVYGSLFGNIKNATIKDVKFENVVFEIDLLLSSVDKIYLSPLAVSITSSKIENVNINATYVCKRLPSNFDEANNLIISNEDHITTKDSNSLLTNINLQLTKGE